MENELNEKEEEDKKKFLEKRKDCYKNEFAMAKALQKMAYDEDEEDVVDETMKNTLINKYSGKLN